ncbi:MAG: CoA transferase [Gammaproteobacteria bacterium]|nr:CoA transferase [Gammaproteobacteria bacterium]
MSELPLAGLKVLDLTIARAGPTAVRLLTDWGADVFKLEPPPSDPGSITGGRHGPDEQNLHRNKRGICLNLKNEAGYEAFLQMVEQVDIFVENFRAPVKAKLKIDYETLCAINPRLIYASISGFGQEGPYSDRAGVDQIVQGMSGLMSITGKKGGEPTRAGIAISDTTAGMFLAQGILLALISRTTSGKGQWVHTSLLEGMLCKLDFQGARYTMRGDIPQTQGNNHPTSFPMGTFKCKDGYINLAAPTDRMWYRFLDAIDDNELRSDPLFSSVRNRMKNKDKLETSMNSVLQKFDVATLVERVNKVGVPCGPIFNVGEAFEDTQAKFLKMTKPAKHRTIGEVNLIRSPINMSAHPHTETFDSAAPDPGEHTAEVLAEFGFVQEQIEELYSVGAVS